MKKTAISLITLSIVGAMGLSAIAADMATSTNTLKEAPKTAEQIGRHGGKGMMIPYTVEELTAYLAMTEEERAAFVQEKETEREADRPELSVEGDGQKQELTEEQKAEMEAKHTEMQEKQAAYETFYHALSEEDKAVIDALVKPNGNERRGPGKGGMFGMTDEEKTAFEAMTDEEKKAYMEAKRTEMETNKPQMQENGQNKGEKRGGLGRGVQSGEAQV